MRSSFRAGFGGRAGGILVVLAVAAVATVQPAAGDRGLVLGATESRLRWDTAAAVAVARDLGLGAVRVTLGWAPGQTTLSQDDAGELDRVVAAASGLRIVVTIFGSARAAPVDEVARDAFCEYARTVLDRYPTINDVVVWNEPNLGFFWQPQFDVDGASTAPGAYVQLLGRCWDVLHAARPTVNVIMTTSPSGNDNPAASSNVSHAPGTFIRRMGTAYRSSGRARPIFDTVGHNPYGTSSAEAPTRQHLFPSHVGMGDLDRLLLALRDGFVSTRQPVPGSCAGDPCPSIWYLEAGYQTVPDPATASLYTGRENDARPLPAAETGTPTQGSQLRAAVRLAYCQPYVGAFFNFLLWDEPDLARWQSGVLAPDGTRKPSYDALRGVAGEVSGRAINCATVPRPPPRANGVLLDRVEWPDLRAYSAFNSVWGFNVVTRERVSYRAALMRVNAGKAAVRRPALAASGTLRRAQPRYVALPPRSVARGTYRFELVLARKGNRPLTERRVSGTFVVR
jgi:hypothetical protein